MWALQCVTERPQHANFRHTIWFYHVLFFNGRVIQKPLNPLELRLSVGNGEEREEGVEDFTWVTWEPGRVKETRRFIVS